MIKHIFAFCPICKIQDLLWCCLVSTIWRHLELGVQWLEITWGIILKTMQLKYRFCAFKNVHLRILETKGINQDLVTVKTELVSWLLVKVTHCYFRANYQQRKGVGQKPYKDEWSFMILKVNLKKIFKAGRPNHTLSMLVKWVSLISWHHQEPLMVFITSKATPNKRTQQGLMYWAGAR